MAGLPSELIAMAENTLNTLEQEDHADLNKVDDGDIYRRERTLDLERFVQSMADWDLDDLAIGDLLNQAVKLKKEALTLTGHKIL